MSKILPLYPGAEPCVKSGYCCKVAACPFGKWDENKKQCAYLTEDNECGQFDYITSLPRWEWENSPAFGAGCSSTMGNVERKRIIDADPVRYRNLFDARNSESGYAIFSISERAEEV